MGMEQMPPLDYSPMNPTSSPMNYGPIGPYRTGQTSTGNTQRKKVRGKRFQNFVLKTPDASKGKIIDEFTRMKIKEISKWQIAQAGKKNMVNKVKKGAKKVQIIIHRKPTSVNADNTNNKSVANKTSGTSPLLKADIPQNAGGSKTIASKASGTLTSLKTDVPEAAGNQKTATIKKIRCFNCYSKDHTVEQCKKPIAVKCVYCGQTGHLRTKCPTVMRTLSSDFSYSETWFDSPVPESELAASTQSLASKELLETTSDAGTTTCTESVGSSKPPGNSEESVVSSKPPANSEESVVSKKPSENSFSNNKRAAGDAVVTVVKKRVVPKGSNVVTTQGTPGTKRVVKKIIRRVVSKPVAKKSTISKTNVTSADSTETSGKLPTVKSTPKSGADVLVAPAPENHSAKSDKESEQIPVQLAKDVPLTSSGISSDLDDPSKKPELDVVFEPVKQVVAKKNIKLNMITKRVATPGDSENANDSAPSQTSVPAPDAGKLDIPTSSEIPDA